MDNRMGEYDRLKEERGRDEKLPEHRIMRDRRNEREMRDSEKT